MKWESWGVNTGPELGKQGRACTSWNNRFVLVERRSRVRPDLLSQILTRKPTMGASR